ncbi:unnamed protein product [Hydatigera taeniaeformis]|uniref:DUF5726 domain-containing protein n=1 Tax=Hydatigena taeniaeformis TaxID=6205 RepID=A0A0R3X2N1_HYDTA|nr:unnamed protein product [Hydatigera taeniaeformis]
MPNKSSATNFLLKSENLGPESRQAVTTLVAASVDIPPFKEGTDFDDWLFFAKADLELYEPARRVPLLVRALPYDLRREAMDAGVSLSSDMEDCCKVLVKLYLSGIHRLQKPEGDLVQLYRPIPPPGTHRKFYHPWSKEPYRVIKALPPTNYIVRNAEIATRHQTAHHNKIRPYTGPPPVGYEDEVYAVPEKEVPAVSRLCSCTFFNIPLNGSEPCNTLLNTFIVQFRPAKTKIRSR